jgi:hypothetical protein
MTKVIMQRFRSWIVLFYPCWKKHPLIAENEPYISFELLCPSVAMKETYILETVLLKPQR